MHQDQAVQCPDCGAVNRAHARTCRLCGTPLSAAAAAKPRVQRKLLRRTDFIAASRANIKATNRLILILLLIGAVLGYLIGWNIEIWGSQQALQQPTVWFVSAWGVIGAVILVAVGAVWSVVTLQAGDKIVLSIVDAHPVSREQEPQLHNVVEEMAIAAGIPKPAIYVIETPAMNAFATGMSTKKATIGVTRGLLDQLNREELQGVIGHEMGHVVNLDMRYATAVGVMVGLIALVADFAARSVFYSGGGRSRRSGNRDGAGIAMVLLLVFAVLAPIFAKLVQMAVSRQREFLADATSVRLTRNPQGLIAALEKLSASAEPFKGVNRATQHLFIVNPLKNFSEKASSLLATHPPLQLRVRRLQNLGAD